MKTRVTKDFVKTLVDLFDLVNIKAEVSAQYSNSLEIEMYVYVQLPDDANSFLISDVAQFLKAYCTMLSYYMGEGFVVKEGHKKNQLCIF